MLPGSPKKSSVLNLVSQAILYGFAKGKFPKLGL